MGRYNFAPHRVYQTATRVCEQRRLNIPPWYNAVGKIPPSMILVRPPLQGAAKRGNKASRLFKPVEITYDEDNLRQDFFHDHPWELARPRQVLEEDGKDYQRLHWSQIEQPGKPLDGESVVQRQRWLMALVRYEMDFHAPPNLLNFMQSEKFKHLVAHFRERYFVTLEYTTTPTPDDRFVAARVHLTYHPKDTHDFEDVKKSLTTSLKSHGLYEHSYNRRTFTLAIPENPTIADQVNDPFTLLPLEKKHGISAAPKTPVFIKPIHGTSISVIPITLEFHRNATSNLSAYLRDFCTTLDVPSTSLIHKRLPVPSPDTFSPYPKSAAYDLARKEFYTLRHQQDLQRRVAREEALFTGAEFGPDPLEVGMRLEDKSFEGWKAWATKEVMVQKQLAGAAYTGTELDEGDAAAAAAEAVEDVVEMDEVKPSGAGGRLKAMGL